MPKRESKKLLQDARVKEEINRHKWIESEKVGYDIGFDRAAEDWISRYADDWEQANTKREVRKLKRPRGRKNSFQE